MGRHTDYTADWPVPARWPADCPECHQPWQPGDAIVRADVVGGLNDEHILAHTTHARTVIAAWGTHPATMPDRRDEHVLNLLRRRPIHCLGTNSDGSPKHPVRLRADTPRHLYRSAS